MKDWKIEQTRPLTAFERFLFLGLIVLPVIGGIVALISSQASG
jgi:hypothetical protein